MSEWIKDGDGWVLKSDHLKRAKIVPDKKFPGMWRSLLPNGELSDYSNLSWVKNSVTIFNLEHVGIGRGKRRTKTL